MDRHLENNRPRNDMKNTTSKSDGTSPGDKGGKRWELHALGLLEFRLQELVHLWLRELDFLGLTGGKDSSPSDVPQKPGAELVETSNGRQAWIRPDAYRDEEGHPQAEVRERYSRTDGAIWAMLAVLEGGEGTTTREGNLDENVVREDYEILRGSQKSQQPAPPANERLLGCALAAARPFHPDLDALPESSRREIVVSFARRIHAIARATREFQENAELGVVENRPSNPARDVRAAELRDLHNLSWVEIGQRLKISPTDTDPDRNDNQNARTAAKRGRELLKKISSSK